MRASRSSLFVLLAALVAQGCGDSVNLGDNAEHWFDGDAIGGGSAGAPFTIYSGDKFPMSYAVDDTTLYAAFAEQDRDAPASGVAILKSCELASCASTVRVLYQQPF